MTLVTDPPEGTWEGTRIRSREADKWVCPTCKSPSAVMVLCGACKGRRCRDCHEAHESSCSTRLSEGA